MTLVALVDDHPLFSAALAVALRAQGFDVRTPALSTMGELRTELVSSRPQVVLLDRDLGPLGSGEELIASAADAGAAVVVVSAGLDDIVAGRCLTLGATACVSKSEPFDSLLATLTSIAKGARPVSDAERSRLTAQWHRWRTVTAAAAAPFHELTPREASVLESLMDGKPVKTIAKESYVAEGTIRTQVRGILRKLDVNSQLEAVGLALRVGWRPNWEQGSRGSRVTRARRAPARDRSCSTRGD